MHRLTAPVPGLQRGPPLQARALPGPQVAGVSRLLRTHHGAHQLQRLPRLHARQLFNEGEAPDGGKGAQAGAPQQQQPKALSTEDLLAITEAWNAAPGAALSAGERNKLLAKHLKEMARGDPFAYELAKTDSKDFMTGAIDARELRDRFVSMFSAHPACELVWKELALLIPKMDMRADLLALAPDPWILPPKPSANAAAAAAAAAAPATAAKAKAVTAAAAAAGPPSSDAATENGSEAGAAEEELPYDDMDEFDSDDEDEGEDEEDEEFEGEEDERPMEAKGWQPLDRTRIQVIAQQLLQEQEEQVMARASSGASASTSSSPSTTAVAAAAAAASLTGDAASLTALVGTGLAAGAVAGASTSSRPAKRAGKKGTAAERRGQAPPGSKNVIMWFRQDLRIHDNPTITEAARTAQQLGGSVTFVFVHSPEEEGGRALSWAGGREAPAGVDGHGHWRPGGASLLWLHHALDSLNRDLISRYGPGAGIVFKRGPYAESLREVVEAAGAHRVFCSRRYEPHAAAADEAAADALAGAGCEVTSYNSLLLREPWEVQPDFSPGARWAGHYGSLTPYYRAADKLPRLPDPVKEPKKVPVAPASPVAACGGVALHQLGLYSPPVKRAAASNSGEPGMDDWGQPIRGAWDMSERAGLRLMNDFLAGALKRYEASRALADGRAVSRLSPYLHWGQLSARLLWSRMREVNAYSVSRTFYKRLIWRDLAYWQLHHYPHMPTQPIRQHYAAMRWASGPEAQAHLQAWQKGQTGFPMVDAGMRELWATGWMQQSVRMICAAFLTEYLGITWVEGARWFHDCLVDADVAINSMMWQNAGKTGLDQWNFTLRPTSRSQDPDGTYIRHWVPELAQLPPQWLHHPWDAPAEVLQAAGVVLGGNYPHRIVQEDLSELRARSVKAIRAARAPSTAGGSGAAEWVDPRTGYDLVPVPKGAVLLERSEGEAEEGPAAAIAHRLPVFTKQEYRDPSAPITPSGKPASGAAAASAGAADQDDGVDEGEDEIEQDQEGDGEEDDTREARRARKQARARAIGAQAPKTTKAQPKTRTFKQR